MAIQIEQIADSKIWIHDGATDIATISTADGLRVSGGLKVGNYDIATEVGALDGLTATSARYRGGIAPPGARHYTDKTGLSAVRHRRQRRRGS